MVLAPFPEITLGKAFLTFPKCEISLNLSKPPCKIPESVVYYSSRRAYADSVSSASAVKVGHTSRGDSGALYLQPATAGVDSPPESRSSPN